MTNLSPSAWVGTSLTSSFLGSPWVLSRSHVHDWQSICWARSKEPESVRLFLPTKEQPDSQQEAWDVAQGDTYLVSHSFFFLIGFKQT